MKRNPLFDKQLLHFIIFITLTLCLFFSYFLIPKASQGHFLNLSTTIWLIITYLFAPLHQFYVLICWRLQLHHHTLTRTFGHLAIPLYVTIFYIIGLARLLLIIPLAISNNSTFHIPLPLNIILITTISLLAIYSTYSGFHYLGPIRLTGMDHFIQAYRYKPFIKKGMYRFTSNALYKFSGLMAIVPGLCTLSITATIFGLFTYLYVWTHFYTTEKPDMKYIYDKFHH
ncbi:hypothetical protein JD969_15355 [Planctomycetota bacterium]|nr:hypothetical protein JD969_15355 [Planctomycetota bacterium]